MLSALIRCSAKPSICAGQKVSLFSPVASVIRLPISDSSRLSVDTCCLYCDWLKSEASAKRSILLPPALNALLIKPSYRCSLHSIGILVEYSFHIPTQQLGCCSGIDFWKVAGRSFVSLATTLCHFIYI